jgi:RNase P subunit RPR2
MADRILCSCITCPKCGTWIVVEREIRSRAKQGKFKTTCGVSECGKEFEFEGGETRVFELPPSIFERRQFYRSEMRDA